MKKFVLLFCVLSIVGVSSVADATEWYAGPIGGVNWGDLSGVDNASAKGGFTGGGFLQADFTARFGGRLEAMYTRKGGENSVNDVVLGAETTILKLDYVDIPLLFVVDLTASSGSTFSLYAGPVFSFNTGGTLEHEDGSTQDVADYLKSTEFSAVIGAEGEHVRSAFSIFFDFSYTIGATNVFDDVAAISQTQLEDAKNRGFAIAAGLKFALSD